MSHPRTLLVRADADARMGTGHVMRGLALAQAWRRRGGRAVFMGRVESQALQKRLETEGFELIPMDRVHPDPQDIALVTKWMNKQEGRGAWVAVDGYHFDPDYLRALGQGGWRVLGVDDMADQPGYPCDIVLNQNLHALRLAYKVSADTLLLLGPRYVLLREEFSQHAKGRKPAEAPERACHVLVTLGGADPDNATLQIVEALGALSKSNLSVKVVVGPANPYRESLERALALLPFEAELIAPAKDMPGLMAWADIAVSGGGTTCWELAFMGVPFAVAILADNQAPVSDSLAEAGLAVPLGRPSGWRVEALSEALARLISDKALRRRLAGEGAALVDGQGGDRVVAVMRHFDFSLRPATDADCELLFAWANDPEVRAASFHIDPIPWEDHRRWFAAKLKDPGASIYIAMSSEGEPMGQVRFDREAAVVVISVSLGSAYRGTALGSLLIRRACLRISKDVGPAPVTAYIRQENTASRRSFAKAGFRETARMPVYGLPAVVMTWPGDGEKHDDMHGH